VNLVHDAPISQKSCLWFSYLHAV